MVTSGLITYTSWSIENPFRKFADEIASQASWKFTYEIVSTVGHEAHVTRGDDQAWQSILEAQRPKPWREET